MKSQEAVRLRPEQPDDEPFLLEVYGSTREEELALTNWDETTREAFLGMQFRAMRRGYGEMFPDGEFSIIELAGKAVGRIVVNRRPDEIRVVDIALLPESRNRGIGTELMRRICAEGTQKGIVIRLAVFKNSRAIRWYERLGFRKIGEAGVHDEMEWRPASLTGGQ
jgi:ribosomal protein S18 acetylase RimI-like enzyme